MSFLTSGAAVGGALGAAGGLASGLLGYFGATSAANTQANSANQALQFQENAFNTSQKNLQPFIGAGQNATYTLGNLLGLNSGTGGGNTQPDYSSFFNSPDYQFAQQQGQRGVLAGANAQGVGLSGGTLKDLSEFNSGLASQQYGNYFNRLMGISTQGANAAGGLASTSATTAGAIGNTIQGVGQAQASGIVGGTNAITGGINSGITNSLLASYLGKSPTAYAGAGGVGGSINGSTSSIGVGGGYQMPTIGF